MASDFLWYLPTHGDGRDLVGSSFHVRSASSTFRLPDLEYLKQVALAAERAGFLGALIPTGSYCEDAWLVAAAIAQHTRRLKSLVAFRPGLVQPAVAAQTVASFQRLFEGRLLLHVVTGGSSKEQRGSRRNSASGQPNDFRPPLAASARLANRSSTGSRAAASIELPEKARVAFDRGVLEARDELFGVAGVRVD